MKKHTQVHAITQILRFLFFFKLKNIIFDISNNNNKKMKY